MARIIVVEQDQLIRALLVEWLGGAGHSAVAYSRVDAMTDDQADAVIVDVAMPRRGGCTKLRGIQAARPETPLIAISAQFTAKASATACELGVEHIIAKPFTRDQLLAVVDQALREVAARAVDT
jgi:DNA-binding response OmpR family regulator